MVIEVPVLQNVPVPRSHEAEIRMGGGQYGRRRRGVALEKSALRCAPDVPVTQGRSKPACQVRQQLRELHAAPAADVARRELVHARKNRLTHLGITKRTTHYSIVP